MTFWSPHGVEFRSDVHCAAATKQSHLGLACHCFAMRPCQPAMPAFHWPAAAHDDTDRRIRSLELEQHVMQRSSISACAAPLSFEVLFASPQPSAQQLWPAQNQKSRSFSLCLLSFQWQWWPNPNTSSALTVQTHVHQNKTTEKVASFAMLQLHTHCTSVGL